MSPEVGEFQSKLIEKTTLTKIKKKIRSKLTKLDYL